MKVKTKRRLYTIFIVKDDDKVGDLYIYQFVWPLDKVDVIYIDEAIKWAIQEASKDNVSMDDVLIIQNQ
jgi:hypothetical protein